MTRTEVHTDHARALATHLAGLDGIDPDWAAAFAEIPRHVFVPAFYPTLHTDDAGAAKPALLDGSDPQRQAEWLDAVYEDRSLVTQCALTPGTIGLWQSTSSSTRPSLMARMLTLLDLHPTTAKRPRVLEIGTGTGYNAGLLCHRLGADNLASVDLDPALTEQAGSRLAGLGHQPLPSPATGASEYPTTHPTTGSWPPARSRTSRPPGSSSSAQRG